MNKLTLTTAIEILIEEMKNKGAKVLGGELNHQGKKYQLYLKEGEKEFSFDDRADYLVEKKYQLRVEHNHSTMKWYAYYAGKDQRGLFDNDIDWYTESDTPTGAIEKLRKLLEEGKL